MEGNKFEIVVLNIKASDYRHGNYEANLGLLTAHLDMLQRELGEVYRNTASQEIRGILVAPEYFFSRNGNNVDNAVRQYSEGDAQAIQRGLSALSSRYPQILIIPGTVAWQKNALPTAVTGKSFVELQPNEIHAAVKKSEGEYISNKKARGVAISDTSFFRYKMKSGDKRLLEVRDTILLSSVAHDVGHAGAPGVPPNDPRYKLRMLFHAGQLDSLLLSRNTAYFYLDGRQVYKYNKRSDYQEVLDVSANVYIPGIAPPVVKIAGISFGIEICLDHACGVLRKSINYNQAVNSTNAEMEIYKNDVNVHLILSDCVANSPAFFSVKNEGGYLLHCSTHPDSQKFFAKGDSKLVLRASRYSTLNMEPFPATQPDRGILPQQDNMNGGLRLDPRPVATRGSYK